MYIEEIESEGQVQLNVEGRIDTICSQEFQDTLLKSFQKSNCVNVNMQNVDYISSAALRAFVLGQKTASSKGGKLTLYNVKPSVMTILTTTGFDSVLTIR